jgi:hypothetical protein
MKSIPSLRLMLLGIAVLSFSFVQPAPVQSQNSDQLRTPEKGTPEYSAILDAVREEYKGGADQPSQFQVNYLKVHNGWAWIDVTPLNASGKPVGDPAPLLFANEKGKWTTKDLNDVQVDGEGHAGPHDPNAKYLAAVQKKYPGIPADIFPHGSQTGDPIQSIKEHYATINKSVPKYKTVKKMLTGFSAEGGSLVAYFDGSKLMKMVANHMGEGGKAVEEYYFWDDRLIFVFRTDSFYDKQMSGKVARKEENRFYFDNDRLIRWVGENSKQIESSNSEYAGKEKDYLQSAKEFADGARSDKSTIESTQ